MATPSDSRVVLLGLMGSGKTTIGTLLAQRTGWSYLDNDFLLHETTGKTLAEYADLKTEDAEALHRAEREVARAVVTRPEPFIAGVAAAVVEDAEIVSLLHSGTFAVYLHTPPKTIVDRIGDDPSRPWLRPDPLTALQAMYDNRDAAFRKAASFVIETDTTPENIAGHIYQQLPRPL